MQSVIGNWESLISTTQYVTCLLLISSRPLSGSCLLVLADCFGSLSSALSLRVPAEASTAVM